MKTNKKQNQSATLIIGGALFTLLFIALKSHWSIDRLIAKKTSLPHASKTENIIREEISVAAKPEIEKIKTDASINIQVEKNQPKIMQKLDSLQMQIVQYSHLSNSKFEERFNEILKKENKEELMNKYLSLKQERAKQLGELVKKNRSRAENLKITFEYHNKLYQIIGKDLYTQYLQKLKETNAEFSATKIVLEF